MKFLKPTDSAYREDQDLELGDLVMLRVTGMTKEEFADFLLSLNREICRHCKGQGCSQCKHIGHTLK